MRFLRLYLLLALLFFFKESPAGEWPMFRGPNADASAVGLPEAEGEVRLRLVWKQPLGMGYSSVSVAQGRAVTLFSDGVTDFAVALDARGLVVPQDERELGGVHRVGVDDRAKLVRRNAFSVCGLCAV